MGAASSNRESGGRNRPVSVIGAGAWGTALANLLSEAGYRVTLWAYEPDVAATIRDHHENTVFLPGVRLHASLHATSALPEAVSACHWLIFAVPSHVARSVLAQMAPLLTRPVPLISATKGIEEETLKLMTQVMEETLPAAMRASLAVLSGPSFAAEVCQGQPTVVSLAGQDPELIKRLQDDLMTPRFRIYRSRDVVGAQLGGALKNVMAVAAGVVDGLQLGYNARAALITRGLAEMISLGEAMGADPRTFMGPSGLGDLVLTCTGPLSRNYSVGVRLGRGQRLSDILRDTRAVAEGVRTSRAALGLGKQYKVEMPIVQAVCAVLFEGKAPNRAVVDLMERAPKSETGE